MSIKRILCLLMVGIIAMMLFGCGKQESTSSNNTDSHPNESIVAENSNESTEPSPVQVQTDYDGLFPVHEPMGTGVGVMPGRVVWAYEPECVSWTDGYWWEFDNFDAKLIQSMVNQGIAATGGGNSPAEGWDAMFRYHNETRGKENTGYVQGEKIAIKANMNGAGWGGPNDETTANVFTTPVALRALLVSMVEDAGIPPECITVYDATRNIPGYMTEYCGQGVTEGVQFLGVDECEPDREYALEWSEEFEGETSYLPTCVTEAEYIINFADLKGHSINGITLTAKNHFGSIINSSRNAAPMAAGLHQFVTANSMGNYTVLVDLIANYMLGEKTILYLLDGLIVSPGEGDTVSINSDNTKWQSEPFNGGYTASLFFSQDPVAIDSVGADFLGNEPTLQKYNSVIRDNPNVENYLHEAGGVADAPSGSVYYDGNGNVVTNLGVHEHWNNCSEKLYSRNLGKDEGIELVQIGTGLNSDSRPDEDAFSALVIYYSWSGNTERIAERLAASIGANTYAIRTVKAYPEDGYETASISQEERRTGNLPELVDDFPDISGYDTIYIGGPIWNAYMPTPLEHYLEITDFSGKTVIPFSTSQGSGQRGFQNDFAERVQNPATIGEYYDFVFPGNYRPDAYTDEEIDESLQEWLSKTEE